MRLLSLQLIIAAAAAAVPTSSSASGQSITTDVLIVSANPGGICAAIAAARSGAQVLLLEPLTMIGGMGAAGGVGLMNQGAGAAGPSGLSRRWVDLNSKNSSAAPNLFPPPGVMANSWWAMVNETEGIDIRLGCKLESVDRGDGACLKSANFVCASGATLNVSASVFIDATYDGDVITLAGGIDYAAGRESRSVFNESLAGVYLGDDPNESFDRQNLTVAVTNPDGSLVKGVSAGPLPEEGSGDDRLMAFSYFPCATSNTSNMVPWSAPPNYNPEDFALLQRTIDAFAAHSPEGGPDLSWFSEFQAYRGSPAAEEKILLCCGRGPVNCDEPDLNRGYAAADRATREAIQAAHKYYLLGSLYYMANDLRVPNYTRYAIGRWGLCADEYVENDNWPPQIYVRISNRLQGDYIVTQNNIASPRNKPSSVSVGFWSFDQHTESRFAVPDPKNASQLIARNEGYMRQPLVNNTDWYDVPFAVMLPKRDQASNLLVPVAISASSIAYSSTRIEGMFADLGTAAGIAASMLVKGGASGSCPAIAAQDVNVTAVQDILTGVFKQRIHGPVT